MPELDDLRSPSVVQLTSSDLSALGMVPLYHAGSNTVRRIPAQHLGGLATNAVLSSTVASDTDLSLNGTTVGADQTTAIQAVLDRALVGPITVYWDVRATAAGLIVHPNTKIIAAPGCGAKLKNSANNALLSNANYRAGADQEDWETDPDYDIITKDANIQIIGGIWHGNGGNQSHDSVDEGWHVALRFFNVENLVLDGVTIYQPRTFSVHFCNTVNTLCRDVVIDCGENTVVNRDGLHFNGPNTHTRILNLVARTWDDAVGINADDLELQGGVGPSVFGPYANFGPITDFVVDGLHMTGGRYVVRILSGLSRVDRITIRNVTGAHGGHLLVVDNYTENPGYMRNAGPGNFGAICWDGSNTTSLDPSLGKGATMYVCADVEDLTVRNVTINHPALGNLTPIDFGASAASGRSCVVDRVTLENINVLGPTETESIPLSRFVRALGVAAINKLTIKNATFQRRSGLVKPTGSLIRVDGATVSDLVIDGVDAEKFASNVSTANSGVVTRSIVSNSNISPLTGSRPGDLVNPVRRDTRNPNVFFIDAAAGASGASMSYYAGTLASIVDSFFGVTAKLPAEMTNGTNITIGSRSSITQTDSIVMEGYILLVQQNAVSLQRLTQAGSLTSLASETVTLAANSEYRLQLECVGTSISAYVQRVSDGYWLTSVPDWQAQRVAFATVTDATFAGGYSFLSLYGGSSGSSKTARFRDIEHRSF